MAYTWDKAPSSRVGVSTRFVLTTASQATANFGAQTYQIRVATSGLGTSTAFIYIKVGDGSVTADSTSGAGMGSNVVDYFCVTPGQKVAIMAEAAGGFVTVSEMQ